MAKPSKDETFASPTRFGRAVDVVAMFSRSIRSKQNQKRVSKKHSEGRENHARSGDNYRNRAK